MIQLARNLYTPSRVEWIPVFLGLAALYLPTYYDLSQTLWATDQQSHGPIILLIAGWLFWQKRGWIADSEIKPNTVWGGAFLMAGLAGYVIGRSQDILLFEVGSQIPVVTAALLLMRGTFAAKQVWFPIMFLVFMVPLPSTLVDALTLPMKTGVSWAVDHTLHFLGYPVSRSGVILHVGQYKLLVADACAGLNTLFTLEAMGLFYLHLIRRDSLWRNIALAIMIVPISFTANTIRVVVLALVTYHYGDEAGQGFLHGFAGMVLFLSALLLIVFIDSLLQVFTNRKKVGVGAQHEKVV